MRINEPSDDLLWHLAEGLSDHLDEVAKYRKFRSTLSEDQRESHDQTVKNLTHAICRCDGEMRMPPGERADCLCPFCILLFRKARRMECELYESRRAEKKNKQPKSAKITNVYLMRNNRNGHIKIGKSGNVVVREATLQSEDPDVEILFAYGNADSNLESLLHSRFAGKRLRGEWFTLDDQDIQSARECLEAHGCSEVVVRYQPLSLSGEEVVP